MGWAVGWDSKWQRYIGYGVPAYCDEPECDKVIDRGLAYVCGGDAYGGDHGCGLFFCAKHRGSADENTPCPHEGYKPTPDHPDWIRHKLFDPSWREWRRQNPAWVRQARLKNQPRTETPK